MRGPDWRRQGDIMRFPGFRGGNPACFPHSRSYKVFYDNGRYLARPFVFSLFLKCFRYVSPLQCSSVVLRLKTSLRSHFLGCPVAPLDNLRSLLSNWRSSRLFFSSWQQNFWVHNAVCIVNSRSGIPSFGSKRPSETGG